MLVSAFMSEQSEAAVSAGLQLWHTQTEVLSLFLTDVAPSAQETNGPRCGGHDDCLKTTC